MLMYNLVHVGVLKNEITACIRTIDKVDIVTPTLDDEIIDEIANFKITGPTDEADRSNPRIKVFNPNWHISYAGKLGFQAKIILQQALTKANENVRNILIRRFQSKVETTKRDQQFKKVALETAISNALADYRLDTRNRLAFLAKQEKIARTLGIAQSTIEVQSFGGSTPIIGTLQKAEDAPKSYYLRVYESIAEETELIRGRKDVTRIIPELLSLKTALRTIEQDRLIENAKNVFNQTPINIGEFKAATYDIYTARQRPLFGRSIYFAIFLMLGVIFAFLVAPARIFLRKVLHAWFPIHNSVRFFEGFLNW